MMKVRQLLILIACLIIAQSTVDLSPFTLSKTLPECTHKFEVTSDYQFAVCANSTKVYVLKWDQTVQNFVWFQNLTTTAASLHQVLITGDGLMIGVLYSPSGYKLQLFGRSDQTSPFSLVDTKIGSITPVNFYITENHQYLSYTSYNSSGTAYYEAFNSQTGKYERKSSFTSCYDCDTSISEDGVIFITGDPSNNLTIYKKNSEGVLEKKVNKYYGIRLRSMVANMHGQPKIYISLANFFTHWNHILVYNQLDDSFEEVASFRLIGSSSSVIYADRTAISPNNKWFAFITFTSSFDGYSLVKLDEDGSHTHIINETHWSPLSNAADISFQAINSGKLVQTITSSSGTSIYIKDMNIECGSQPHSTGVQVSETECQCEQGYSWDSQTRNCIQDEEEIDCARDPSSTGIMLQNSECQCLTYHYWDSESLQCLPHCNRNLAKQRDPQNIKKCLCRGSAKWNQVSRQCSLDCLEIDYSTGQQQWEEVCQCKSNTNWNPESLTCELNCKNVYGSTGQYNAEINGCICKSSHAWVAERARCMVNCVPDDFHTGEISDDGTCQCAEGARWNQLRLECVSLDCRQITYSTGASDDGLSCECEQDFQWSSSLHMCVIHCDSIEDPLSTGSNLNSYECSCKEGSVWNQAAKRCIRQCSAIQYSTGVNVDRSECQCQLGFVWNPEGSCDVKCGSVSGETGEYDAVNNHCECKENYQWSHEHNACSRVCSIYQHAFPYQGPSPSTCECYAGYSWDSSSTSCKLQCDGQFDVSVNTEQTECVCETNAFWTVRNARCLVKCVNDELSTGVFSIDRCVCKVNSLWNNQNNACQCMEGYQVDEESGNCEESGPSVVTSASLGAIGGAVASGSLIFLGKHFYDKKKLKDRQKKEQQEKEGQNSQRKQKISNANRKNSEQINIHQGISQNIIQINKSSNKPESKYQLEQFE